MVPARTPLVALALALTASSGCADLPAGGVARGQALYANCVQCHGADGAGSTLMNAPPIAGLPAWYVEAQVTHFQTGLRGAHPDDVEGLKMRPMSRTLKNEADVKVVAEYIATLPQVKSAATIEGDAAKGQASFATCAACHGPAGLGNPDLKAPPIAGQADWYIVKQLGKFKAGVRAYDPADSAGATMKGIAGTIQDEAAMRDLATYIHTL